ncbi:MAG: hypothetical protein K8U03_18465 [Planctomycetia bacterium]|nr:hypothetical protein [Planctomycetia bacterium]
MPRSRGACYDEAVSPAGASCSELGCDVVLVVREFLDERCPYVASPP